MAQKTALSTIATPGQTQTFSAKTAAITVFPVDDDDVFTPTADDLFYNPRQAVLFHTPTADDLFYEATD